MKHFTQYPMMRPYVGSKFRGGGIPSLLLIGESHYLPEGSLQHVTAGAWYGGSSATLNEEEIEWISTGAILESSRAEGFSNKAHSIWSNPFWVINEYGPGYGDYTRVADDISFCNFFLRPGLEGESLVVGQEDVDVANEAFGEIYEDLKPSAVVFLSTLAHYHFRHSVSVPVVATPHPGCAWWNRPAAKYGNKSGWQLLADFVRTLNWKRSDGESAVQPVSA
jgi:hypothetical protein